MLTIVIPSILNGCNMNNTISSKDSPQSAQMELPSEALIKYDKNNGTITYLKGENLSEALEKDEFFRGLQSRNMHADIAFAFLMAYRSSFKLMNPADELIIDSITTDDLGLTHIRFQHIYEGIPIWASEIIIHLDRSNHVYLFQGSYIPSPEDINTIPALTEDTAFRLVVENLRHKDFECAGCRSGLVIYPSSSNEMPRLAYRVTAAPSLSEGWTFIIDANTGEILEKLPTVHTDGIKGK